LVSILFKWSFRCFLVGVFYWLVVLFTNCIPTTATDCISNTYDDIDEITRDSYC
jgi:uncharacterized membrane-anchored protein